MYYVQLVCFYFIHVIYISIPVYIIHRIIVESMYYYYTRMERSCCCVVLPAGLYDYRAAAYRHVIENSLTKQRRGSLIINDVYSGETKRATSRSFMFEFGS